MRPKRKQSQVRFAVVMGTILTLILIILWLGLAWPGTITRADLPSLDTPVPGSPDDDDDSGDKRPPLAHIELQVQPVPGGAWSVVQWQDSDGNWHDVEGWRSPLPENGVQRWAVGAKDFNTGPFRWLVRQGQAGSIAGISDPFDLPAGANETVRVTVDLN